MQFFIVSSVKTSNLTMKYKFAKYNISGDNIKMDLLERGLNVVDWIGLAQDRYRWRALVNSVMNLRVP
jgi:hypothetical protein